MGGDSRHAISSSRYFFGGFDEAVMIRRWVFLYYGVESEWKGSADYNGGTFPIPFGIAFRDLYIGGRGRSRIVGGCPCKRGWNVGDRIGGAGEGHLYILSRAWIRLG